MNISYKNMTFCILPPDSIPSTGLGLVAPLIQKDYNEIAIDYDIMELHPLSPVMNHMGHSTNLIQVRILSIWF